MLEFVVAEARIGGIIVIGNLERTVSAYRKRFFEWSILSVVEVIKFARSHHHIVARLDGFDAAGSASPRHYGGVRSQTAFENLVPTDDVATLGVDKFLDAVNQIALQFIHVLETFLFHAALAVGARAPSSFAGFVAANVNVVRWEKVDNLAEHIFEEMESAFLARAEVAA